jgi:hypothetical protein
MECPKSHRTQSLKVNTSVGVVQKFQFPMLCGNTGVVTPLILWFDAVLSINCTLLSCKKHHNHFQQCNVCLLLNIVFKHSHEAVKHIYQVHFPNAAVLNKSTVFQYVNLKYNPSQKFYKCVETV